MRLQAGRGGAAAVGLPRRHAGRARGGGVRRLRGAGLGRRAADRAARRPRRPRHGPGLARARPRAGPGRHRLRAGGSRRASCTSSTPATATTRRCRWCTRTPHRCAGWRSSTCWSTTPTARAVTSWPCRADTGTASTTASASTRRTSCARSCGAGPSEPLDADDLPAVERLAGDLASTGSDVSRPAGRAAQPPGGRSRRSALRGPARPGHDAAALRVVAGDPVAGLLTRRRGTCREGVR